MFKLEKIFSNNKSKLAEPSKKHAGVVLDTVGMNSFVGQALLGQTFVSPRRAMQFYRESAALSTAVDYIGGAVEQIPIMLKDIDGGFVPNHPVLDFLRSPNPVEDYQTFIGQMSRNYLLTGNAYMAALGSPNRPPIQLWTVSPQDVTPVENGRDQYTANFLVVEGPAKGDYIRFEETNLWRYLTANDLQELHQIRGFISRTSKVEGDSLVESILLDINQQVAGKVHNAALLRNGGNVSLVAVFKDTMTAEQHEERKSKLQRDLGGSSNAGKIAVVSSEDMEIIPYGQTHKDMDFANLGTISEQVIYKRYEIPLALVSTEASTYNNYETARLDFYDRAVIPNFDKLTAALTEFLLPRFGLDPTRFKLTYNPETIPALRTRMLDELSTRKELGLETINELRESLPSREAVEGGDTLLVASNLTPLGQTPIQTESQPQMPENESDLES